MMVTMTLGALQRKNPLL